MNLAVTAPGRAIPWVASDLIVAIAGLMLLLAWEFAGLDLPLARLYGDLGGFDARDGFVSRDLIHDGGRWLSMLLLLLQAVDVARPLRAGPTRPERAGWLAVVGACLLVVPLLKRFSRTSCPWDLATFGGWADYVPHWRLWIADQGPGHCFPSGHAVAAFAFFGLYFLWRPHDPRLARWLLAATLLLGTVYGWAQLVRGAHFASHTMWSAWLCWALAAAAAAGWNRVRPLRRWPPGASG